MAKITLVTGGSRSGKSAFARQLAENLPGPRVFIATCPPIDWEIKARIHKHQMERKDYNWHTVEETVDLVYAFRNTVIYDVTLVDCLTLWVNNLLEEAVENGILLDEEAMGEKSAELREMCNSAHGAVIFVTNEVGMGIVPADRRTRLYRDLVGKLNQDVASWADEVFLVSCGIPIRLK
jgi:adenosylcobinamide kinase/adenosylcobinamide-phosphate guanylyltransferase